MVYQGNNRFRLDPSERAELWEQALAIPSDPNGPPDLEEFDKLCLLVERHVNREIDYHCRMRLSIKEGL